MGELEEQLRAINEQGKEAEESSKRTIAAIEEQLRAINERANKEQLLATKQAKEAELRVDMLVKEQLRAINERVNDALVEQVDNEASQLEACGHAVGAAGCEVRLASIEDANANEFEVVNEVEDPAMNLQPPDDSAHVVQPIQGVAPQVAADDAPSAVVVNPQAVPPVIAVPQVRAVRDTNIKAEMPPSVVPVLPNHCLMVKVCNVVDPTDRKWARATAVDLSDELPRGWRQVDLTGKKYYIASNGHTRTQNSRGIFSSY